MSKKYPRYRLSVTAEHATGTRKMVWRQDVERSRTGWFHAEHEPGSWLNTRQMTAVLNHLFQVGHIRPITIEVK